MTPVSAVLLGPADAVAVVGPPGPDVIEDHVVAVHDQAGRRPAWLRAADAEEHIAEDVAGSEASLSLRVWPLPTWSSTGEFDGPASKISPEIIIPLARRDCHWHDSVLRHQRREAETEHDRVGTRDLDALVQVVDARGQDQVLAGAECIIDRLLRCPSAWR